MLHAIVGAHYFVFLQGCWVGSVSPPVVKNSCRDDERKRDDKRLDDKNWRNEKCMRDDTKRDDATRPDDNKSSRLNKRGQSPFLKRLVSLKSMDSART